MSSKAHEFIAGLIVRKMREKGYLIVSFDGNESLISNISFKIPPTIKRHRPDILGIDLKNKRVCVGEAKTKEDLNTKRTKEQLQDYFSLIRDGGQEFEVILGIPQSAQLLLQKLLRKLGMESTKSISYIWMPDELIYNDEDEEEYKI